MRRKYIYSPIIPELGELLVRLGYENKKIPKDILLQVIRHVKEKH
jgi:hypothetical protein